MKKIIIGLLLVLSVGIVLAAIVEDDTEDSVEISDAPTDITDIKDSNENEAIHDEEDASKEESAPEWMA